MHIKPGRIFSQGFYNAVISHCGLQIPLTPCVQWFIDQSIDAKVLSYPVTLAYCRQKVYSRGCSKFIAIPEFLLFTLLLSCLQRTLHVISNKTTFSVLVVISMLWLRMHEQNSGGSTRPVSGFWSYVKYAYRVISCPNTAYLYTLSFISH